MNAVTTSVIVPVYNDPEGLETTVDSLLDQTAEDYEIIIADNGSTDRTRPLAAEYATRDGIAHVIEDEIQSSYAARNAGIEAATGDVFAFIDADMWVESDWVESVQRRIERGTRYLGCNVSVVVESDTLVARYNSKTDFPIKKYIRKNNFVPTCCLVVDSNLIADVGKFDVRLISGGDVEFGHRVYDAGYNQEFAADICMYHPARDSLVDLLQKRHRIGRGKSQRAHYHGTGNFRHPLHPFGFLPVRPSVITDAFTDEPLHRQMLYFILAYVSKLSQTTGRVREWRWPMRGTVDEPVTDY
jgi:glycosyltransferase involved in cell wall biosynthesis